MESLYCTIFIVDVSQNPEEVDTVSSRIQQLIEDHGGIIKKVNPWGKQKLAYPIQNRTYGFYVEIEFTANSHFNIPKTIEQEYRINDRVLRYLTYVVTKKELKQREINAARMKERAPMTNDKKEPVSSSEKEPVSTPGKEAVPSSENEQVSIPEKESVPSPENIVEETSEVEEQTAVEETPAVEKEEQEESNTANEQEDKPKEEQEEDNQEVEEDKELSEEKKEESGV